LYNVVADPGETEDIASEHPELVEKLSARLEALAEERPALGDKPLLMRPRLPYVYGREENMDPPQWLIEAVEKVRSTQPDSWPPGETPWPQAPKLP
jgi:hypothetical protein